MCVGRVWVAEPGIWIGGTIRGNGIEEGVESVGAGWEGGVGSWIVRGGVVRRA